jgi:hypothetical protein
VQPYFVNDGPQYDQFKTEVAALQAKPPGGAAMVFTMTSPTYTKLDNNTWLVKGNVRAARPGEQAGNYPWELHLTRKSAQDPWLILSVRQY